MAFAYKVLPNRYYGGKVKNAGKGYCSGGEVLEEPSAAIQSGQVYGRYLRGVWHETNVPPGPIPTPEPLPPVLSPKDFWQRFTAAEREALQNLVATGTQQVKNKINAFREYVRDVGEVDAGDAYVVAVLTQMENAGVIGPGRAAEILAP